MSDKLLEAIKDYIVRQTDYALMIEGEWGTGKTYALQNEVLPMLEQMEMKPLYVSLFGVSTVDQLARALLSATWVPDKVQEFADSKVGKSVSEFGKILVSAAASIPQIMHGAKLPTAKVDFENFLYLKENTVLCFDDMERCKIPSAELLGFINKFLEHDRLKVILVANENKLDAEFKDMIEKLVRLTLRFKPNLTILVPAIIDQATSLHSPIRIKMHEAETGIINFCTNSKISNMRTLKYAIGLSSAAFGSVGDMTESLNATNTLMFVCFTIAIANEVKSGIQKIREFMEYKTHQDFQLIYNSVKSGARQRQDTKGEQPYILEFVNKYFAYTEYAFSNALVHYVVNGILPSEVFAEEMRTLFGMRKKDPVQILANGEWYRLTDEEFTTSLQELMEKIKNGQLAVQTYPIQFLQFINLARFQLIDSSLEDLKHHFLNGMEKSLPTSTYSMVWDMSYDGVNLTNEERAVYESIKTAALAMNKQLKVNQYDAVITDIRTKFDENFESFLDIIYSSTMSITDIPILSILGSDFLCNILTSISNEKIYRTKLHLEQRYKLYKHDTGVIDEIETLNELVNLLRIFVTNSTRTVKSVIIEDLCNHWETYFHNELRAQEG